MPEPVIIQSLWIGDTLSNVEQLCLSSFIRQGHRFHLYTYGEVKNVPAGVELMDATAILPSSAIFTYQKGWGKGSYAGFADLFRYHLLFQRGGWWVDTDVICLRPFDRQEELLISTAYEGQAGVLANNCIMKAPRGHRLYQYLVEEASRKKSEEIEFAETGPHLVQRAIRELQLEGHLAPYHYFNPIGWKFVGPRILGKESRGEQLKNFLRPIVKPATNEGLRIKKDSYSVHLWNEVWRQNGWGKNDGYKKSSLFEQLKKKYGIA